MKVKYSGVYYRPQDVPAGEQGWYVDRIEIIRRSISKTDRIVIPIRFKSEAQARRFERMAVKKLEKGLKQ